MHECATPAGCSVALSMEQIAALPRHSVLATFACARQRYSAHHIRHVTWACAPGALHHEKHHLKLPRGVTKTLWIPSHAGRQARGTHAAVLGRAHAPHGMGIPAMLAACARVQSLMHACRRMELNQVRPTDSHDAGPASVSTSLWTGEFLCQCLVCATTTTTPRYHRLHLKVLVAQGSMTRRGRAHAPTGCSCPVPQDTYASS